MTVSKSIARGFTVVLAVALAAVAQPPATKAVQLVVPFTPGNATDVHARAIAPHLATALARPVIVENRAGAGGTLGAENVARSSPDGMTILMGGSSVITVAPNVYPKLPYDPVKDLAPVTLLTREPFVLVVRPSLKANNIGELTELARSQPGKLNYASYGNGTLSHLGMEILCAKTGIQMVHVPYKGTGPAFADLMGEQVDVMLTTASSALAQIAAGRLKAIAVTTSARIPVAPTIPTLMESGVEIEIVGWIGAFVPAGTPKAVIERLNTELARIIQLPEVREGRQAVGAQVVSSTPEELAEIVRRDLDTWAKAARTAGGIQIN